MNTVVFAFLFFCAFSFFSYKRLLRYLRYLQQENYEGKRFLEWVWKEKAFDRHGTAVLVVAFLLTGLHVSLALSVGALLFMGIAVFEDDPRRHGKLKLKMTERAKRICVTACALFLIIEIALFFLPWPMFWVFAVAIVQALPFLLAAAVVLLSPDEARRQRKLVKEAQERLKSVAPYVIGITGSYGKTSTKDALGNILQVVLGPTFWPEKGVNTSMGITREIRMRLKTGMRYAVIEMAAYGRGSIARLCKLTPPSAGIITGAGVAHLDRFGGRDAIRLAKAELAEALPDDGILVCNGDNAGARAIAKMHPKKTTLLYGFDNTHNDLDCWISAWEMSAEGTRYTFRWKGKTYKGALSLFGQTALSNVAAAFTLACALGAQPEFVVGAIANLQAVSNRLEVKCEKGITYLKDAYNSNPDGFSAALDVLKLLPAKRRILVTPGMIELAGEQAEQHEKIGRKASQICDFTIIVGTVNRDSLVKGLLRGGQTSDQILLTDSREQALGEMQRIAVEGDAILIENDLPDLYEAKETY